MLSFLAVSYHITGEEREREREREKEKIPLNWSMLVQNLCIMQRKRELSSLPLIVAQ